MIKIDQNQQQQTLKSLPLSLITDLWTKKELGTSSLHVIYSSYKILSLGFNFYITTPGQR